jgi:hypothetical protein
MNMNLKTLAATFGALTLALVCAPVSNAQCGGFRAPGITHSSFHSQTGQPRLLTAAYEADEDSAIVGFWHVKFLSEGTEGIPNGAEIDAGYSQWHSDGTEIMNSGGRSPITSSFCLGTWEKVGDKYILNHFAIAWNAAGTELLGPANIREEVTLNPEKNYFSGTFTIDQYSEAGAHLAHVQGASSGTRIGIYTEPKSVF